MIVHPKHAPGLVLISLGLGWGMPGHGQPVRARHPNLDGVWIVHLGEAAAGKPDPGPAPLSPLDGTSLPQQPWAQALEKGSQAQAGSALSWPGNNQRCLVAGMLRAMRGNYPWRLIETPEQITILFEEDGRLAVIPFRSSHVKDALPTWNGDSIARWEGDTLVVDTMRFNGKTPLPFGVQITTNLHMTHRFHLTPSGQLEDRTWISDVGAFTRPFEVLSTFDRWPDTYHLADYRCAENNQDFPEPLTWWGEDWGPQ